MIRNKYIILLLSILSFSSCGLEFDIDEEAIGAESFELSIDTAYVRVGDRFVIPPVFKPDTLTNQLVFWVPENDSVIVMHGDTIEAVGPGTTVLHAISVSDRLTASCEINVYDSIRHDINNWYPYETVVYADVKIDGDWPKEDQQVLAYVGFECRGIGKMMTFKDHQYMVFRIATSYHTLPSDDTPWMREEATFVLFDKSKLQRREFDNTLILDGEAHGTLSNLYKLTLE